MVMMLRLLRGWRGARICLLVVLLWLASWIFLNGLVLVHRNIFSDFCTDHKSKEILQRLCDEYHQGAVTGDLCQDLCVSHQVQYKRCLYYENGKKVMLASWRGLPIVLKSKRENFTSYETLALMEYQDGDELSPLDVVFYATLEIKNSLGLEAGTNLTLPRLWGHKGRSYSRAELASLWALLQQEEYTFLRLLQDLTHHVARILGSCGHFYAVEYLVAGRAWDQNIFSLDELASSPSPRSVSVKEMVPRVALSFLEMVEHFEKDFSHRLHLCDIKAENFAIRRDLTVVAIDVDMAFFEPKMREILEQNCTSDNDCNFFDCTSTCDTSRNRCGAQRRNSNLQVICEKIFRPWFSPTLLGEEALLPLQVALQQAVQECADIDFGEDEERRRRVKQQLKDLLQELVEDREQEARTRRTHTALHF